MTDSIEVPEPDATQDDKDTERKPRRGGKRGKKGPLGRLALFYRQIIAELRKVVWPNRNDLTTYTTVVIVFVVVVIGFVAVVDWGFGKLISAVFG
ncbi:preprotein translocase subunit SecE [Actinacidiphila bryophytorum]|uniref:preprotein translocase subunit SecE n=1 Tax=Actinacidiphila bryophytorum TaxID=1436133 RepID=UPI001961A985|nr:preprotein translocase subunit SecE [Actinacidiphila bryophytorum]MBM9436657.1 preprotein translocase subunit SecE [Actinacidiphila bryophytorum]MBN6546460.1 preprotein translocase subunit SecE [Actinacidiphila bryophytorum]UWE14017.1 preprotein translocase subunit SecE [Actinacidiphila bryophytorum]